MSLIKINFTITELATINGLIRACLESKPSDKEIKKQDLELFFDKISEIKYKIDKAILGLSDE